MAAAQKTKDASPLQFVVEMVPENVVLAISDNRLMLQVIFFAIFFGICLVLIPRETAQPVISFVQSVNAVFFKNGGAGHEGSTLFCICSAGWSDRPKWRTAQRKCWKYSKA